MNGYYVTVNNFLSASFTETHFIDNLNKVTRRNETTDSDQGKAWVDCFFYLRKHFREISDTEKENTILVFEYELCDGTIPDLLIVIRNKILIVEFKSGLSVEEGYIKGYIDQVNGYYDKLTRFNKPIWEKLQHDHTFRVQKYLVFTKEEIVGKLPNEDFIKIGNQFKDIVNEISYPITMDEAKVLLKNDHRSSPDTLQLLSSVITEQNMPDVFRNSENIRSCIDIVNAIINSNEPNCLNLILVNGAPGSGKTALGFSVLKEILNNRELDLDVKYVTGNGNLFRVFTELINQQVKLKTKKATYVSAEQIKKLDNVSSIQEFVDSYINNKLPRPIIASDVIIFDEAQRAWSIEKVALEYEENVRRAVFNKKLSQPYMLLHSMIRSICETNKSKTLICLMGKGQEIYKGEENGEDEWIHSINRLIKNLKKKQVDVKTRIFLPELEKYKVEIDDNIQKFYDNNLYLIDNKRGYDVNSFLELVEHVLNNEVNKVKQIVKDNLGEYKLYITQDFQRIKNYQKSRDENETRGLLCNSYEGDWVKLGYNSSKVIEINNKKLPNVEWKGLGSWFINRKSNDLDSFASEFNCQGLELDLPVLIWGKKMVISNGVWKVDKNITNKSLNKYYRDLCNLNGEAYKEENFISYEEKFVKNIFRVLLTRGRKGLIIYIEDDNTYAYFRDKMSLKEL